jgi:uncharacterized protein (TIGR02145 family)
MRLFTKLGWTGVAVAMAVAVCVACFLGCGNGNKSDTKSEPFKTVKINGKTWMAENLNVAMGNSWCYNDNESYCSGYGRLYDRETAKKVCPFGWHLPTVQEWDELARAAGGVRKTQKNGDEEDIKYWYGAGKMLKSKDGWKEYKYDNDRSFKSNGTDKFGFSALPGGTRSVAGVFSGANETGVWWTATGDDVYFYRAMSNSQDDVLEGRGNNVYVGFSVRCVAD